MQLFQRLENLTSRIGHSKRRLGTIGLDGNLDTDQLFKPVDLLLTEFLRWVIDEYFYSDIDKGYFDFNLMQLVLRRLQLNLDDKGLAVAEWNAVRKTIGKPRRFSQNLVNQELEQLNTYRERARIWLHKKQLINDGLFPKELTHAIQNLIPLQVVFLRL